MAVNESFASMTAKESSHLYQFSVLKALHHLLFVAGILYLCLLLHLAFASNRSVCRILRQLDPSHTCDNPIEANHAADCRLNFRNFSAVIDRFVLAHLLGWLFKALLIPDRCLLWIASLTFEVIEFLLSGYMPTFKECWWDSLLLDVLLCNFIGIELGYRLIIYLSTRRPAFILGHCCEHLPHRGLKSGNRIRHFALKAALVGFILLTDLNAFLLKKAFLVTSASPLNVYRLIGICVFAIPSLRELTARTRQQRYPNFGGRAHLPFAFLFVTTLGCELVTVLSRSINTI